MSRVKLYKEKYFQKKGISGGVKGYNLKPFVGGVWTFTFALRRKSPPLGKKEGASFVVLMYWPELYIRSEPPYSTVQ